MSMFMSMSKPMSMYMHMHMLMCMYMYMYMYMYCTVCMWNGPDSAILPMVAQKVIPRLCHVGFKVGPDPS